MLPLFPGYVARFPGKYVTINLGTNDAGGSASQFYLNISSMVQTVLAAGKVPVVPTIPWAVDAYHQANIPALNAQIQNLYAAYPGVVRGPDLWTLFQNNPSLISSDQLHPTNQGCSALRTAWAGVAASSATAPTSGMSIAVSGNHLVDGAGKTIRLLGVDRSGTEYMCIANGGIFDGPNDAASVAAIAAWHANAVRVPLNADCWLGINGVTSAYGGATYQNAIVNYVNLLHQNGMYAILDLHWTAAGTTVANAQTPMPDTDHAPTFWASVATTFKQDHAVLFDLYNEPYGVSWACLRDGCTVSGYTAAGMQSLVDAVRATGATQPLMIGGLAYSNDLSQWLVYKPTDTAHALVASLHLYNFNTCNSATCWDSTVKTVAAQVPVVTGELGENDCLHGFIDGYMNWADAAGVSYLGWAWNTYGCGTFPSLVTDFQGTPTAFGIGLRDHFLGLTAPSARPASPRNLRLH
jgi:hypothetical protein